MDLLVPRSRQLKIQIYVVHLGDTQTGAVFFLEVSVNPFAPNAPFLYLLKTSENLTVFSCFQRVEKRRIGNKWVNLSVLITLVKRFSFGALPHVSGYKLS